jgi:hypothetical protein
MSVRQPRQQYRSEYDASPPDLVNLILSPFAVRPNLSRLETVRRTHDCTQETAAVINDIMCVMLSLH